MLLILKITNYMTISNIPDEFKYLATHILGAYYNLCHSWSITNYLTISNRPGGDLARYGQSLLDLATGQERESDFF